MSPLRRTAAVALAVLSILTIAAPVAAKPGGGNSAGSAACDNGGYRNWTRDDGTTFKNAGHCTRYTAKGNALVPVVVPLPAVPFAVTYTPEAEAGEFDAFVFGAGLEPGSSAGLFMTWGNGDLHIQAPTVASTAGTAGFLFGELCTHAGQPVTALVATGTPAGGVQTSYTLPLPDASICP